MKESQPNNGSNREVCKIVILQLYKRSNAGPKLIKEIANYTAAEDEILIWQWYIDMLVKCQKIDITTTVSCHEGAYSGSNEEEGMKMVESLYQEGGIDQVM
eukprot:9242933-Ditylum_brightwellii.AAC.1